MEEEDGNNVGWILSLVIFGLLVVVLFYIYYMAKSRPESPELVQSAVLILGVIALILAISLMASIYKRLKLADKEKTLGLPEGSVRAIIALALIVIFIMSSTFLFSQIAIGSAREYRYDGITQEEMNNISKGEIVSITRLNETNEENETLFNVIRLVDTSNEAARDIGKQIITTLSTLVVAIAAFYFGAKTIIGKEEKAGKGEVSNPVISGVDPNNIDIPTGKDGKKDVPITITGKNFLSPTVELRPKSGEPIKLEDVLSNPTKIKGTVTIKQDTPAGEWTLVVTNSDKGETVLEKIITIGRSPPKSPPT